MQNTVSDSIRSDLESFKGIRERVPSESSLTSIDGYESDGTLDNVSEIAESESELESSASSELLNCTSEYAANSSSHLVDSTTFREQWMNTKNGLEVIRQHVLPTPPLLVICAALHPNFKAINCIRKTCADFASGVNMYMERDENLPPLAAVAVRISMKKGLIAMVILMRKDWFGLHPITYSIHGELKKRVAFPRKKSNFVAMVEYAEDEEKCREMAQNLRGRVKRLHFSVDDDDESLNFMEELKRGINYTEETWDFAYKNRCLNKVGRWNEPFVDAFRKAVHKEVQRVLRLRKRQEEETAEETDCES